MPHIETISDDELETAAFARQYQPPSHSTLCKVTLSCGCVYRLKQYSGQQRIEHVRHGPSLSRQQGNLPTQRDLSVEQFLELVNHYLAIQKLLGTEEEETGITAVEYTEIEEEPAKGMEPRLSRTNPEVYAEVIREIKEQDR